MNVGGKYISYFFCVPRALDCVGTSALFTVNGVAHSKRVPNAQSKGWSPHNESFNANAQSKGWRPHNESFNAYLSIAVRVDRSPDKALQATELRTAP
jgi:hypothetical protein